MVILLNCCLSSGADIVGVNCKFDPTTSMEALRLMKEALDKEGLHPHLMIQPVGFHTPDAGRTGFSSLPETPFGKKSLHCAYASRSTIALALEVYLLLLDRIPFLPLNTIKLASCLLIHGCNICVAKRGSK